MHIFCKKCNFHFPPEGHIIFNTFNIMTSKCVPTQLNTKDSDDMLTIRYCAVFGVLYQKNQIYITNFKSNFIRISALLGHPDIYDQTLFLLISINLFCGPGNGFQVINSYFAHGNS